MTYILFNEIFDREVQPFIDEINGNNSLIELKDIDKCKTEIFEAFQTLYEQYEKVVFGDSEKAILDRHKVASCICGAFLRVSVFNKTRLVRQIRDTAQRVEPYFYYVNELVALYAASQYLAFFMGHDENDEKILEIIMQDFPRMPRTTQLKKGFWNSVLFNLAQIKDENQIGLEHYDLYAYAMFFFYLEQFFYSQFYLAKESAG